MEQGSIFLAVRMAAYLAAGPVAVFFCSDYNPVTETITIDVSAFADLIGGWAVAGAAFLGGRVAKARGWAT